MPFFLGKRTSKDVFYRCVYAINNCSFNGLSQYEQMPLSKFELLCEIHSEAVERMKPSK
jgi:hypothetical protein